MDKKLILKRTFLVISMMMLFTFAFIVFAILLFPRNAAEFRPLVLQKLQEATGSSPKMKELAFSFTPPSVETKGLEITPRGMPAMAFKTLFVGINPIRSLSSMGPAIDARVSGLFGGKVAAAIDKGLASDLSDVKNISLDLSEISLAELLNLMPGLPFPMTGDLSGQVNMGGAIDVEKLMRGQIKTLKSSLGDSTLKIKKASIDTSALQKMGFAIPPLNFEEGNAQLQFTGTKYLIEKLQLGSPSDAIRIKGTGTMELKQPIMTSKIDLTLHITMTDDFQKSLGPVAGVISQYKNKGKKGSYSMKVMGDFYKANYLPVAN